MKRGGESCSRRWRSNKRGNESKRKRGRGTDLLQEISRKPKNRQGPPGMKREMKWRLTKFKRKRESNLSGGIPRPMKTRDSPDTRVPTPSQTKRGLNLSRSRPTEEMIMLKIKCMMKKKTKPQKQSSGSLESWPLPQLEARKLSRE